MSDLMNNDLGNFNDLFNLKADDFIEKEKQVEIYKPTYKNGKNGVYKSVIRWIPWFKDPKNMSKIKKFGYWLEHPVTKEARWVDCPTSIGKKSIINDLYWKLFRSNSFAEKELAEKVFKRKENYYSLIQIIKDENNTSLEGKIMVYRYSKKVAQKLDAASKPEIGPSFVPFDAFESKLFLVNLTKQGEWNNYDLCQFAGELCPMVIDGKPIQKTQGDLQRLGEYLSKASPDLNKYAYKEWDEDTYNFVLDVIRCTVPAGAILSSVLGEAAPAARTAPVASAAPVRTERPMANESADDLPMFSKPKQDFSADDIFSSDSFGGDFDSIENELFG